MMSESSKRHSKFLSLIFILKCLSKASVIRIFMKVKKTPYKDMSQWNAPNLLLNTIIKLGNNDFRNQRTRISKNNYVAKNQTKIPVSVTIWFPVHPTKTTYLISCFPALLQQIMTKIVTAKLSGTWELFAVNAAKRK